MTEKHSPPQTILVTGTNGMLGRPLAARLAAEGRTVIGYDLALPPGGDPGFSVEIGDLRDGKTLSGLFSRYSFDGIVHCGGISGPMVAPNQPLDVCATNISATAHLLEIARQQDISRFVHCSSIAAYGAATGAGPIAEDGAFRPADVYGATKAAGDALVHAYREEHGLDGIALRIGRVYGPGRTTSSFVATLIEDALAERPTKAPGDGNDRYQYVYRDDVVTALACALDAPRPPLAAYNIGNAETTSDQEIAAIVHDLIPDTDITFDKSSVGQARQAMDITAAQNDLGYTPNVGMHDGIAAYIDWMRHQ
jgi:nucleoside-diphosphate-sugar epimerase